jgi:hypothetical protein
MENPDLKMLVFVALDNAKENGYDALIKSEAAVVADDMIEYDAALADYTPNELIPYIEIWQRTTK